MAYKTGSISLANGLALYALIRYFDPKSIFEVGTFIGKSAIAMVLAMDRNGNNGAIHTCDKSNDFHIPLELVSTPINGYPKKSSHEVLNDLNSKGAKFDFLHIDGRLGPEDWELLEIMVGKTW